MEVAQAATAGDPLAQRLLDREGELIGIGLVNMLFLYSPELILLGGGISKKAGEFVPRLKLRARVEPAELRNQAGIVGAALATLR